MNQVSHQEKLNETNSFSLFSDPQVLAQLAQKHILVADQDVSVVSAIKSLFGDSLKIIYMQDGLEAQTYLKNARPDLVLASEDLPSVSGKNLINAMRFTKHLKEVPAVLLTHKELEFKYANRIMTKPLAPALLYSLIQEALILKMPEKTQKLKPKDAKHVLVVEDGEAIAILLERILQSEGFKVTRANTLTEAKEKLLEAKFQLVLLDVNLPDGTGFDLLKALPKTSPCIVLSTLQNETMLEDCLALGAKEFIPKPFNPRELVARIKVHAA